MIHRMRQHLGEKLGELLGRQTGLRRPAGEGFGGNGLLDMGRGDGLGLAEADPGGDLGAKSRGFELLQQATKPAAGGPFGSAQHLRQQAQQPFRAAAQKSAKKSAHFIRLRVVSPE